MLTATSNHPELTEALRLLGEVDPVYAEAECMYDGEVDEVLASQKLKEILGDSAKRYRVNYARTPVDVLLERTKVNGFTVQNSAQLAAIEQAWDDNQLGIEAKDVHLKAYEYGDSYIIGWGDPTLDNGEPDPDFPGRVSAYCHGPRHVRVFYDPEKPRKKQMAIHRWTEPGSDENGLPVGEVWQRVNLYFDGRIEKWVSAQPLVNAAGFTNLLRFDAEYRPYLGDDDDGVVEHEFGIPVFHFRTARPYGRPEHADAYGPQYAINKLLVSLMGHIDFTVLPQRYVATESQVDQNSAADAFSEVVGDTTYTPDEYGQDGLDPHSTMDSGPGNVWLLSGKSVAAGQFAAGDSKNFIEPMQSLVDQLYDVCDIPENRRHGQSGQQPSGDSQRMSEQPIKNKTGDRQSQFGVTWHEFLQFVCDVNGLGETDAQVNWSPGEPATDRDSWQTFQLKLIAGIPWDQAMREQGYTTPSIDAMAPYAAGVVQALIGKASNTPPAVAGG